MKKTIIKATLLVVAISLSIYGVLHWKHTVVDPPKQLEFDNSHLADLSKSIFKVSIDSLEIGYQECQYKLRRYQKEELINPQEATTKLEDLVGIYTPHFITKSKTAFSNSVWDKKSWSHSFMIKRIEELKNLTIEASCDEGEMYLLLLQGSNAKVIDITDFPEAKLSLDDFTPGNVKLSLYNESAKNAKIKIDW